MALTACVMKGDFAWTDLNAAIAGFTNKGKNADSLALSALPLIASANAVYFEERTLAASATVTLDLQALTNPALGYAIVATKFFGLAVQFAQAAALKFEPGASNPFSLNLAGTGPSYTVQPGFLAIAQTTHTVVDATHKTIKITNTGGISLTCDLVLFLGQ